MYKMMHIETKRVFLWSADQLLHEVNRDRSDQWKPYDLDDLKTCPDDVFEWIYEYKFLGVHA